MAISYKRTIIQIPLEDVDSFKEYSERYGLSMSSTIIFLAKKSLEQEQIINQLPDMINIIKQRKNNRSHSNKNVSKIKN